MSLALEMKRFEGCKQAFQKVTSHKIMKFVNFKNGGNNIQWGNLHVTGEIL